MVDIILKAVFKASKRRTCHQLCLTRASLSRAPVSHQLTACHHRKLIPLIKQNTDTCSCEVTCTICFLAEDVPSSVDCLVGTLDKNLQDVSKARIRPAWKPEFIGQSGKEWRRQTPHPQKQKRLTLRLLPDQLVIHRSLCFWWQVEGSAQVDRRKRERIPPVEYYAAPTPHSSVELNCTSTTLCSRHI